MLIVAIQIRDLEARVELLSGGKDEAMSEMRNILKGMILFCVFSSSLHLQMFRLNARKPNAAKSSSRRERFHRRGRRRTPTEDGMGHGRFYKLRKSLRN